MDADGVELEAGQEQGPTSIGTKSDCDQYKQQQSIYGEYTDLDLIEAARQTGEVGERRKVGEDERPSYDPLGRAATYHSISAATEKQRVEEQNAQHLRQPLLRACSTLSAAFKQLC
jgi:hypothetical protein